MTIVLELDRETEVGLAERAAEKGISLHQYVRQLLEERVSADEPRPVSPKERADLWRRSTEGLPRTAPLSDQAISREAIYDQRG
jgi:hypothetical protein